MQVFDIGDGTPQIAVVGLVHGDEPSGKYAVERFISQHSDADMERPVRLIIANERAHEHSSRYLDEDLNRAFPVAEANNHEQELARQLDRELEDVQLTLALHSTRCYSDPFVVVPETTLERLEIASKLNVDHVVKWDGKGSLDKFHNGITLEVGPQGSDQAIGKAYNGFQNFLHAVGALPGMPDTSRINLFEVFEAYGAGDEVFTAKNFQAVEQGEQFAESADGKPIHAERKFYPVLMSTNGYESQLGCKARLVGEFSPEP